MQQQNSINYKYYAESNEIVDDNNSITLQVRVDERGKAIVQRSPARAASTSHNFVDVSTDHRDSRLENGMDDHDGDNEGHFDRNNINTPAGMLTVLILICTIRSCI